MISKIGGAALAVGLVSGAAGSAAAHVFDVKQLEVNAGAIGISLSNTFQTGVPHAYGADIVRNAYELGADYGALPWLKLGAIMKFEKPEERDARPNAVSVEGIAVLKPLSDHSAVDFGMGWYTGLDVSAHPGTTNVATFGPILSLKVGKVTATANPFLEQTFGRNHVEGIALNYGWNVKYEAREGFAFGIEGFGLIENLGNAPPLEEQEHRTGPAVFMDLTLAPGLRIAPDIGVLFGLTRAVPDVAVKLNVGVPLSGG